LRVVDGEVGRGWWKCKWKEVETKVLTVRSVCVSATRGQADDDDPR